MAFTNMKLIEAKTVGAGGIAAIEFTSIPQTYTDLKIVYSARTTEATTAAIGYISFNGSTSNFSNFFLQGNGATIDKGAIARFASYAPGTSNTASVFSNGEIYIPNYKSTTAAKSFMSDAVVENNATTGYANFFWNMWNPGTQVAITSISLATTASSWVENSTFYLYGVTSTSVGVKATGGNIISQDADYYYHIFTSSGTFTPTESFTADYLVVAGGAGGASGSNGGGNGGGGGAGGARCTVGQTGGLGSLESPLSLTAQAYTVTIGAGGAGGPISDFDGSRGTNGNNSVFSTITSTGGGGGGAYQRNGYAGGSGGGAGQRPGDTGGAASPSGQGFAGGNAVGGNAIGGAGGGGAGAVGGNCVNAGGGRGGIGIATTMGIGGSLTYYAGGGGGSTHSEGNGLAIGGLGGGGNGRNKTGSPVAAGGTTNTGGGGGGGGEGRSGAAGGSGIVIVRYAK